MKGMGTRRLVITCIAILLFVIIFMGRTMLISMAKEDKRAATPYYKSIQIQKGDSLWGIASRYKEGSSMNTHEYVNQLKQMNNLKKDTIHTGQYLTIVYFKWHVDNNIINLTFSEWKLDWRQCNMWTMIYNITLPFIFCSNKHAVKLFKQF